MMNHISKQSFQRLSAHVPFLFIITLVTLYLYGTMISPFADRAHENLFSIYRLTQYINEFKAGFYQPQLFMDSLQGAGHAFPVFYPPMGYAVAMILNVFTGNVIASINCSFFLSALLSGYTAYLCGFTISKKRLVGLVASILFLTASYRFVNIYVRAALAESWFLVWVPLIAIGIFQLMNGKKFWLALSIGVAGAILSHAVMTFWLGILLVLCNIPIAYSKGWKGVLLYGLGGFLGLLLAAFFVVPQQAYLSDVLASNPGYMWADWSHLEQHRVFFYQLFSFDALRYTGGSSNENLHDDTMNFSLGLGGIVAIGMMFFWCWNYFAKPKKRDNIALTLFFFTLIFCWLLYMVAMMFPVLLSWFPAKFGYIQFPWRLLGILAFIHLVFFSFVAKSFVTHKAFKPVMVALAIGMVISVPSFFNQRQLRFSPIPDDLTKEHIQRSFYGRHGFSAIIEYAPTDFKVWSVRENWDSYDLPSLSIVGGTGEILSYSKVNDVEFRVKVSATNEATVYVPLLSYSFWRATTEENIELETGSSNGFLVFAVPDGTHNVSITRHYTKPYYLGWTISLAAILILILLCIAPPFYFRASKSKPNVTVNSNDT